MRVYLDPSDYSGVKIIVDITAEMVALMARRARIGLTKDETHLVTMAYTKFRLACQAEMEKN